MRVCQWQRRLVGISKYLVSDVDQLVVPLMHFLIRIASVTNLPVLSISGSITLTLSSLTQDSRCIHDL